MPGVYVRVVVAQQSRHAPCTRVRADGGDLGGIVVIDAAWKTREDRAGVADVSALLEGVVGALPRRLCSRLSWALP